VSPLASARFLREQGDLDTVVDLERVEGAGDMALDRRNRDAAVAAISALPP